MMTNEHTAIRYEIKGLFQDPRATAPLVVALAILAIMLVGWVLS